jgi:hypothetical protein
VGYLLTVLLALLIVPAVWVRGQAGAWSLLVIDLPLFALSGLSVARFYVLAQAETLGTWRGIVRWLPFLMVVGAGLSLNNARAVWEALRGRASEFRRTPKYNLARGESASRRHYRAAIHGDTWIEAALGLYFAAAAVAAGVSRLWGAIPFFLLFAAGYAYTAGLTVAQAARRWRHP